MLDMGFHDVDSRHFTESKLHQEFDPEPGQVGRSQYPVEQFLASFISDLIKNPTLFLYICVDLADEAAVLQTPEDRVNVTV